MPDSEIHSNARRNTSVTTHATTVDIVHSVPSELEVGADVKLKVNVSCTAACDLSGAAITVCVDEETVIAAGLSWCDRTTNETDDLHLRAPEHVGKHVWRVMFPGYETDAVVHEESWGAIHFRTTPHSTSMAVWDVPSPVVINRPFTVKVGVKCSASCHLAGQVVEVRDESGTRMGAGTLSQTPWPGTAALYVAELDLIAPPTPGTWSWTSCFAEADLTLPHADGSAVFGFLTGGPADLAVTTKITDKHSHAPIENVEIRCGRYRGLTNAQGVAILELPAGIYDLNAWKPGYEDAPVRTVEVTSDLIIYVETTPTSKKDLDDERVWM